MSPTLKYSLILIISFLLIAGLAGCSSSAIDRGEALFLTETFSGNGRTCSTCHTPTEGFSISPQTIQQLPLDNVLFVPVPGLENLSKLLSDGLIFVNDVDDGIIEFRQTPKLTHLRGSCDAKGNCGPLGLRGDRERNLCKFSNEAIANHFTRKVNGVDGVDFRSMTKRECDDMVAFLTSRKVSDVAVDGN